MIYELGKHLHMQLECYEIKEKEGLPLYLSLRDLYHVHRNGVDFLIIELPSGTDFKVSKLEKQLGLYQSHFKMNAAFSINNISRYQRDAMVQKGVPFVSLPKQIYLPFLGVMLQNYFRDNPILQVDKFTPISQALFLMLAYSKKEARFSKSDAAKKLGVTNTTITRASKQLKAIGVLQEEFVGTSVFIKRTLPGAEYFELGKPYLINPIQQTIYIKEGEYLDFPASGELALSNLTMLNPPQIKTLATWKNTELPKIIIEVDPQLERESDYLRLEQWKYSPMIFAKNGNVDPISLYCILREEKDERVEIELERMMETIKWQ